MNLERFRKNPGPSLLGVGIAGLILTVVIWILPLGLIDGFIFAPLVPLTLLCLIAGAGLTYLKSKRNS